MNKTQPIWQADPKRKQHSCMQRFIDAVKKNQKLDLDGYDELYSWSISHYPAFWKEIINYFDLVGDFPASESSSDLFAPPPAGKMRGGVWFQKARFNFAENLLRFTESMPTALWSYAEGRDSIEALSGQELLEKVAQVQEFLEAQGVIIGDRVAGVMSNTSEAIVAMLATTSLGAIWSSCSPDFGVQGIIDRFVQIEPKVLFFTEAYQYQGKIYKTKDTIEACVEALSGLKALVGIDHLSNQSVPKGWKANYFRWQSIFEKNKKMAEPHRKPKFVRSGFDHPIYILFSSGTTGVPKCIIHGAGGTLLQHFKELALHTDLQRNDRLMYFTTCGWMMWNWMISALGIGTPVVLFEGSPNFPDSNILWQIASDLDISVLGTSPKFLSHSKKSNVEARKLSHSKLRTILSTGSPLLPEHYEWVYQQFPDIHLASISGGTDIVSCFMLGNPLRGVFPGQIQGAGLGMNVQSWDEQGKPCLDQKGELVCCTPFPSMPIGFWGDPHHEKFQKSYFEHYTSGPEVWHHGDFIEIQSDTKGIIVYGRSDATLNPGGVRIGTAELYRTIEQMPEIADSIVVGRNEGEDVAIVLFVKLPEDQSFDDLLQKKLRDQIRRALSPRHVPKYIFCVNEIPYTRSGKKVELTVQDLIHGRPVKNEGALANAECLAQYAEIGSKLMGGEHG